MGRTRKRFSLIFQTFFWWTTKNSFLFSTENGIPKQSISLFLLWAGLLKQTEKKVLPVIFSPPDCCPVSGYSVADKRARLSSGLLCVRLCSVWISGGISPFLLLCRNKSVFSADMQSVKAEDVESLIDLCMSANTVLLLWNLIAELHNRIHKQNETIMASPFRFSCACTICTCVCLRVK